MSTGRWNRWFFACKGRCRGSKSWGSGRTWGPESCPRSCSLKGPGRWVSGRRWRWKPRYCGPARPSAGQTCAALVPWWSACSAVSPQVGSWCTQILSGITGLGSNYWECLAHWVKPVRIQQSNQQHFTVGMWNHTENTFMRINSSLVRRCWNSILASASFKLHSLSEICLSLVLLTSLKMLTNCESKSLSSSSWYWSNFSHRPVGSVTSSIRPKKQLVSGQNLPSISRFSTQTWTHKSWREFGLFSRRTDSKGILTQKQPKKKMY